MIKKLELTNFRGVKKGSIELDNLTIILGSNNSGKTTILEALFLAPNPLRDVPYLIKPQPLTSAASTIHELHKTLDSEGYAFLFHRYISDETIIKWNDSDYLKMISRGNVAYLTTNQINIFHNRGSIRIKDAEINFFGSLGLQERSEDILNTNNKNVQIAPNSLLISAELMRFALEYIRNNWARITNTKIPVEVAKDISRFVWEDYVNITIEPHLGGRLSIFGLLKDGTRIRLGDLGSGTQAYVIAKMLYEVYKPEILLYDDIEAHLNPRLLMSLAEWFLELNEKSVQVVVTTHSLEAARTIASVNEESVGILIVSIEDGELKARKMTLQELEESISGGLDVRIAEAMMF